MLIQKGNHSRGRKMATRLCYNVVALTLCGLLCAARTKKMLHKNRPIVEAAHHEGKHRPLVEPAQHEGSNSTHKKLLNKLYEAWDTLIPEGYDETLPSKTPVAPWTRIKITPFFVTQLSMKDMDYSVDFSTSLEWEDNRLQNQSFPRELPEVYVPKDYLNQLWIPDILFGNSKGSDPQAVDVSNLRFRPQVKRFFVSRRRTLRFSCVYVLKNYPFDVQYCSIQVTYEHSLDTFISVLIQALTPEEVASVYVPPEFQLVELKQSQCTNKTGLATVKQSCQYVFAFRRIYRQHIMLVFTPSILIVVLSWIAFLLPIDTAGPRVALGLTTLLTLITQMNAAQKDLPAVADLKALDIWMFMCIIMVFSALVQFATSYIHYLMKTASSSKEEVIPFKASVPKYVSVVEYEQFIIHKKLRKKETSTSKLLNKLHQKLRPVRRVLCPAQSNVIDSTARIVFPLVFTIFNIVFWTHYLR